MRVIKQNKQLMLSIISLAIPAIIEMSLHTLVGIADTLMISRIIGKEALAASGYANQIVFTIIFIFSSFNIGATAIISRSYGEKNYKRLNDTVGQNLLLNLVIGLTVTILGLLFSKEVMGVFDTPLSVFNMGVSYLNIVLYSQIFMFISFAAAASLRGVEDTRTPMVVTGVVNMLNIAGNYVLMTGAWIFPDMGIKGAALSTTVSRFIGAVIYIVILVKSKGYLKLNIKNFKISKDILKSLWNLSSVAGIEQLLMQTSFFVMGVIVSLLDTDSEAGFRIMLTIEQVSFMPAIGFSLAAATLVGKALGEKKRLKALSTGYISLSFGILWGVLIGLVFILFRWQIIGIFTDDIAVISKTVTAMIFAGLDQPLLAFIIIMSGALRGAGDTKTVMIITSLRLWLGFIPLSYIFIVMGGMGIKSIWIAEIATLVIVNMVILKRFKGEKWADIKV